MSAKHVQDDNPAHPAIACIRPHVPAARMGGRPVAERRRHRRHELSEPMILAERLDPAKQAAEPLGLILDLSAGGVRLRAADPTLRPGAVVDIRLRLPDHAGISPFVCQQRGELQPTREWIGQLAIQWRIEADDGHFELGGRLIGLEDANRGMFGLYLSTQPLAA